MNDEPLQGLQGQRWDKIRDLGRGASGLVQLCQERDTCEYAAIKFVSRKCIDSLPKLKAVKAEIMNLRRLQHDHVVSFKEVFLTDAHICVVMEYARLGNLHSYIRAMPGGHLTEDQARWFFQQLILAMDYCHKRGVVNRDIKLQNTLLQEVEAHQAPLLKICDFGVSKAADMSDPKTRVGTLPYMPPEVLKLAEGRYDGRMADLWSCGVMLYVMLFGVYPFEPAMPTDVDRRVDRKMQAIVKRILSVQWSVPDTVPISDMCRDILTRLLDGRPENRITIPEIFEHPWFLTSLPCPEITLRLNEELIKVSPELYQGMQPLQEVEEVLNALDMSR